VGVESIGVYLLKPRVADGHEALREPELITATYQVSTGETTGMLYVADGDEHEPDWVRLLGGVSAPPLSRPRRTTSAVLMLGAAGRWFAIPFGASGRSLLERGSYERDFGLKVALNGIDRERIRGAQARTFSDYVLHSQRQVSRLSDVEALEIDDRRDLVTALSGVLRDKEVGRRIDGRDAARLTADLDAAGLAPKCAELLALSEADSYADDFPWVGKIEEVRDPEEVATVERLAFEALGKREFALFDLYPPEFVADEIVEFGRWPGTRSTVIIEPGRELLKEPIRVPMSADQARQAVERYRLVALDRVGEEVDRWTYLECLHYETRHEGSVYVLDAGAWYRIELGLVEEVDKAIAGLRESGLKLPSAGRRQNEGEYNKVTAGRADLTLVDKKLVYVQGRSSVEPCDLLSDRNHLVHVKPCKGGSSPLSHLFAQATVSAECLLGEPAFREKFQAQLRKDAPTFALQLDEPIRAHEFSVVLALITDHAPTGAVARELPFFSRLTLRIAVQRLRNMRFKVYVDEIPRTQSVTPPTSGTRARRAPKAPTPRGGRPVVRK
jgi:uncharacterized protein (TIGR04141 family)